MRRSAALLLVLVSASCTESDTGVLVTVTSSSTGIDQLAITTTTGSMDPVRLPATPDAIALPTTFFAKLPDHAVTATFDVTGWGNSIEVAHGVSMPVDVVSHHVASTTVTLDAVSPLCRDTTVTSLCKGDELFCDGFETSTGPSSFPAWTTAATNTFPNGPTAAPGTLVEVTAAKTCEGTHALHAVATEPDQQAFVYKTGLAIPTTTYVRAMIYIPSTPGLAGLTMFLGLGTVSANFFQIGYDPTTTPAQVIFRPSFGGASLTFPAALPLDRWFCLSAKLLLAHTGGAVYMSIDGMERGATTNVETAPADDTYDRFAAGIYAANSGAALYLDDAAVSGTPLDCL